MSTREISQEVTPRASIDTVIADPPANGKDAEFEETPLIPIPESPTARNVNDPTGWGDEVEESRRLGTASPGHQVERNRTVTWEHMRRHLGLDNQDRDLEWQNIREQAGLVDGDEEAPKVLLRQLLHAILVLATTPFILLHGLFKGLGAFLRSLGMVFTSLSKLCKKLTVTKFRPRRKNAQTTGPIQI